MSTGVLSSTYGFSRFENPIGNWPGLWCDFFKAELATADFDKRDECQTIDHLCCCINEKTAMCNMVTVSWKGKSASLLQFLKLMRQHIGKIEAHVDYLSPTHGVRNLRWLTCNHSTRRATFFQFVGRSCPLCKRQRSLQEILRIESEAEKERLLHFKPLRYQILYQSLLPSCEALQHCAGDWIIGYKLTSNNISSTTLKKVVLFHMTNKLILER